MKLKRGMHLGDATARLVSFNAFGCRVQLRNSSWELHSLSFDPGVAEVTNKEREKIFRIPAPHWPGLLLPGGLLSATQRFDGTVRTPIKQETSHRQAVIGWTTSLFPARGTSHTCVQL